MEQIKNVKAAYEIGLLVKKLTPSNQAYVMNSNNALLFSQQSHQEKIGSKITQK